MVDNSIKRRRDSIEMPKSLERKHVRNLEYIIKVCERWKDVIESGSEDGRELLIEFEEEGVLEVLSSMVLD